MFSSYKILPVIALAVASASPVLFSSSVEAQEKRGRLEDGRAYRVGADGFQLVDEIAELQVSNDDLRKQVAALGAELDACEASSKNPSAASPVAQLPAAKKTLTPDCDELVSNLYLRISRLESTGSDSGLPPASVCDYASEKNPLNAKVSQLQQRELELQQEIAKLQLDLKEAQASVLAGRETTTTKPAMAQVEQPAAIQPQEKRARLATPLVSQSGSSELDQARARLESTLRQIDSKISKRKSLYDRLRAKNGVISIQLRRLETVKGVSLDSLRRQVQRMKTTEQHQVIYAGLREVRGIIDEDIALIERFLK